MVSLRMTLEQDEPKGKWIGTTPKVCDLCGADIIGTFVDGRTDHGSWAIMCTACYMLHGVGLGTSKGQLYNIRGEKLKG